jgi:hypothetical protein
VPPQLHPLHTGCQRVFSFRNRARRCMQSMHA